VQAYHQYSVGSRPALQITKKGALDSQPQVIKFTSCLPMVGGSLRVHPASSTTKTCRHDIAEILLKVALKHQISNQSIRILFLKAKDLHHNSKLHFICITNFISFCFVIPLSIIVFF
jgi:hypothetical protein